MPVTTRSDGSKVRRPSPDGPRANVLTFLLLFLPVGIGLGLTAWRRSPYEVIVGVALGIIAAQAPQVAKQWERAIVLRLGQYKGLQGPGLFWIIPFFDTVSSWIDQRVITTSFAAEETLTSDTVPV